MNSIITRRITTVARDRLNETPVLLLEGPRGVGKSTLLSQLASDLGMPVFDLDQPTYRQIAQTDPSMATEGEIPVLIDEYQRAPVLLDMIKARLNRGTTPGMFILAGSASYDSLPPGTQALTGRIQRLPVMPLTQTEIDGSDNDFLARAFMGDVTHNRTASKTTRLEYIERVTRGGMPLALAQRSPAARNRWFEAHVRQSLERDAGELRRIGRTTDLRDVLTRTVGQTGNLLNVTKVAQDISPSWGTVSEYIELLESLFLVWRLPPWGVTLLPRSVGTPKIHVVDSGLGSHLLRLTLDKMKRLDPAALTEFGHLLESFVVQEVVRQATWLDDPVAVGHWRSKEGAEVDLVLERYDGAVVAIEIKAGDQVPSKQLAGLQALRDRLGRSFIAGVVCYLGPVSYQPDDRLHVLPIEQLWA